MTLISPSLLSADFLRLGDEISAIEKSGADLIHIDVMDGHFVPNLTLGPPIIRAIKRISTKPLDVHLMIEKPDISLEDYAEAGANMLTVHVESVVHLERTLKKIRSLNMKAGAALNPSTHESALTYVLDTLDLVLIMSVNPGFGGQSFLERSFKKISAVQNMLEKAGNTTCLISVDGGINEKTGRECVRSGANCLVAGSYIFGSQDYRRAIDNLKS